MTKLNGCKHLWPEDSVDDAYACLLCGAIAVWERAKDPLKQHELLIVKPGKPDWAEMSYHARREWYHQNAKCIIADVERLGEQKARKKWNIAPSTWTDLRRRWKLEPKDVSSIGAEQVKHEVSLDTLPAFPQFSDSWPAEVQLKWLETYRELARG